MNKLDFCVDQILKNNFAYKVIKNDNGLSITNKEGVKLFDLFFDDIKEAEAYLSDVLLLSRESIKRQVKTTLEKVLPSDTIIIVSEQRKYFGEGFTLAIGFYPKAETVNNVRGQYAQKVSLSLDFDTLELEPQIYGGSGGRCIYRTPDENNSYLAMQRIKIPFRKPKPEVKFVLKAVQKFAERWLQAIKDNKDVLMYHDLIDYDKYLNS